MVSDQAPRSVNITSSHFKYYQTDVLCKVIIPYRRVINVEEFGIPGVIYIVVERIINRQIAENLNHTKSMAIP